MHFAHTQLLTFFCCCIYVGTVNTLVQTIPPHAYSHYALLPP